MQDGQADPHPSSDLPAYEHGRTITPERTASIFAIASNRARGTGILNDELYSGDWSGTACAM
jgi:hypothetical protein